jgi:F0F1-type ATP synthase membrane subunit b/b'
MSDQVYVNLAIWSQVASSVVFIAAMIYLWLRYLQPMVLAAQARSNAQIAEAERHRSNAKAALDALREEVDNAAHDAELIRERAKHQAEREHAAIVAEANVAGERLLRNASGELERARAAGRERLRGELVLRALDLARNDAERRVDRPVQECLIDDFLATLERAN